MLKNQINHYIVLSEKKADVMKRVNNRTPKSMTWKEFSHQGNYKCLDVLPKIVKAHYYKKHRTIGLKPAPVTTKAVEKHLMQTVYNRTYWIQKKIQNWRIYTNLKSTTCF